MAHMILKQKQSHYRSQTTSYTQQLLNRLHHYHGLPPSTGTQRQLQAGQYPASLPELWDTGLQSCQDLCAASTSSESLRDRCREAEEPGNTKLRTKSSVREMTLCHWASSSQYFKESQCLNHQSQVVQEDSGHLRYFKTMGTTCPMTQRHAWHYESPAIQLRQARILHTQGS